MADVSVVATVISTSGALLGGIGGVYLANRVNVRREEAQADRQRKDQQTQARREANLDLLGTVRQLRAEIEIAGQQHWKDMNVRLATIQQHAVSIGVHASRVALLSSKMAPETAEAAGRLELAARRLTAVTATNTELLYQDEQFLGGRITLPADFTEFDECIERFSRAAAQDREE